MQRITQRAMLVVALSATLACKTDGERPSETSADADGSAAHVPVVTSTRLPAFDLTTLPELAPLPAAPTMISLVPTQLGRDASFGEAVAISGDRMVIGAPGRASSTEPGSVYVFERDGTAWTQTAQLFADPPIAKARLGISVAIDGDTIVAGSDGLYETNTPGRAHVFERDEAGAWQQRATLELSHVREQPSMQVVGISGDVIILGNPNRSLGEGNFGAGAVDVYARTSGAWAHVAELMASDAQAQAAAGAQPNFGWAAAISGNTIVVGARQGKGPDAKVSMSGGAYVFEHGQQGWTEVLRLPQAAVPEWTSLGHSLDIDGDSMILAVPGQRSAWTLRRVDGSWRDSGTLPAIPGGKDTQVGVAVAIHDRLAAISVRPLGSHRLPTMPGTIDLDEDAFDRLRPSGGGTVHLYQLGRDGWTELTTLAQPEGGGGDEFGAALAFGQDLLVIGANRSHIAADGSDTGAALLAVLGQP